MDTEPINFMDLPFEDAVLLLMEVDGISRALAEFHVRLMHGDVTGDIIIVPDEDGEGAG